MKIFKIIESQELTRDVTYFVQAETEEEAKQKILNGDEIEEEYSDNEDITEREWVSADEID